MTDSQADVLNRIDQVLRPFSSLRVIILFGSVASGKAGFDSDLDLAVEAPQPLELEQRQAIIEALALEFGRPVDLMDIRTVGQPLFHQILSHGRRVRGSSSDWGRLIYRDVMENEDFVPYQQRILEARLKRWVES